MVVIKSGNLPFNLIEIHIEVKQLSPYYVS